jgi:tetratricopeptide (TPR) repeat protein
MLKNVLLALLVAFVGLVVVAPAAAAPTKQDKVMAKKAAQEAKKHAKKGDWEEAREAWQKSVDLNDTPDARLDLAKAEAELGHLLLAEKHIQKVLENPKLNWGQKKKANKALKDIDEKIPTLTLELPAEFSGKILVDDEEKERGALKEPLRLDPGEHKVHAEADGYKPFDESVVLEQGDRKNLTVLMAELPKAAPKPVPTEEAPEKKQGSSTQKTLGWVSIAVGGVGLVVGTVMGLQARSTRNELNAECANDVCTEAQRDLYDKGTTQAGYATAGFIVGGVGIGLGTVLLLTAGSDKEKSPAAEAARIEPVIGPAQLGVRGSF